MAVFSINKGSCDIKAFRMEQVSGLRFRQIYQSHVVSVLLGEPYRWTGACLTSPLTMRTLASHHPHGSLSFALEYTWQTHTHSSFQKSFPPLNKADKSKLAQKQLDTLIQEIIVNNIINKNNKSD